MFENADFNRMFAGHCKQENIGLRLAENIDKQATCRSPLHNVMDSGTVNVKVFEDCCWRCGRLVMTCMSASPTPILRQLHNGSA